MTTTAQREELIRLWVKKAEAQRSFGDESEEHQEASRAYWAYWDRVKGDHETSVKGPTS